MKITLHLVWNDFRRLRWWIALLALALVAQDVFGFALLYGWHAVDGIKGGTNDGWIQITAFRNTLFDIELVCSYIIVLLLVQSDSLHGTRAFWLTRPVAWKRLLASKMITGAIITIVLPVLVFVPLWLWCGFGPEALGLAALKTAAVALLFAIPGAFVGAMCDSLSRAVVWGCLIVPVVVVGLITMLMGAGGIPIAALGGAGRLGAISMAAITLLSFALATVVQYATRNSVLAAIALVAGIVLATRVPSAGRGLLLRMSSELWDSHPELAKDVSLEVPGARVVPSTIKPDQKFVAIGVEQDGQLPTGTYLTYGPSRHVWTLGGGIVVERYASPYSYMSIGYRRRAGLGLKQPAVDRETEQWKADRQAELEKRLMDFGRNVSRGGERLDYQAQTAVSPSIVARIAKESPPYEGMFEVRLMRPRIVEELELARGLSARQAMGCSIVEVSKHPGDVVLLAVDTRPVRFSDFTIASGTSYGVEMSYLIQKSSANEAVVPYVSTGRSLVAGVTLTWRIISTTERVNRGGKWVPPEKPWYEGAKLAIVTADEVARFTRTIKVPAFELEPLEK